MELAADSVARLTFDRIGRRTWLRVGAAATYASVFVNGEFVGEHLGAWTPFEFEISAWLRDRNEVEVRCADCLHFSNGFLPTIGMRWTGVREMSIHGAPAAPTVAAPQRSGIDDKRLLIDGRPTRIRGILHWGYYPELGNPWPAEAQIRREIIELQALGFNLIKFCLWIPPPLYYELCDELGMLVWQEYPTWNAPLRGGSVPGGGTGSTPPIADESRMIRASADEIARAYHEYFLQDRAYGCVVIRTLTCENDHVDPTLARRIIGDARRLIPGCVIADNSGWFCNEHVGDFHDEHPYVHNAHWKFYGARTRGRLARPLLLGETMVVDSLPADPGKFFDVADAPPITPREIECSREVALSVRRHQIQTLARDLPDVGYVICALRDLKQTPLGLYTAEGVAKYAPQQWSWHGDQPGAPREIRPVTAPFIGPRKGQWKCPENTWWSPIVRVYAAELPADLIAAEAPFDLLSGRVLARCDGARVLVEQWDLHSGTLRRNPLVIEFLTQGERRVVSALRHDTPVGREIQRLLDVRRLSTVDPPPEIGPLVGTSIVLDEWQMSVDGQSWSSVRCDTPLVNNGANMFEGWATFRAEFEYPGGARTLRCESVGDYFECRIDGEWIGSAGPRDGTWDGTRDVPREFPLALSPGRHEIEFRVRDWRAGGGMVGPVFIAADLNERIF